MFKPVGRGGDNAHILGEVLHAERLDRNGGVIGVANGGAEQADGFADTFAMMMERAVREMRERALAGIEPVMKREIVGGSAAMCALR